jgi:hypothetical protein
MNTKKEPSDESESGKIVEPAACNCEDGCCNWHDNTTAQSEEEKSSGYPSAPGPNPR